MQVSLLLAARMAPVIAPLVMEFQGSSFPRTLTRLQSIIENKPPQTAKLPGYIEKDTCIEMSKIIHFTLETWGILACAVAPLSGRIL